MNAETHLLQITDPHLFASTHGTLRGVDTLASLQQVLAHARRQRFRFEAVLCTGDLVHDEPGGYAHLRRELGTLDVPVLCVPGNHDDAAQLRAALQGRPFQVGGLADVGDWRLVLLDSSIAGQPGGRLAASELEALEQALGQSRRFVVIGLHHHPVAMGSAWLDAIGLENAAELFAIVDRHPHVRALVWGHVHQSFEGRRHGVRLIASPSTCVQFLPGSREFALDHRPPAYRRITLRADGTIGTSVVWIESAGADTLESIAI